MSQTSDHIAQAEGILVRVARGDAAAVTRVIDTYGPLVWFIARTYFTRRAEAEEAVQEAFIKIWRSAHQYDPTRGSERAFIATIVRNRVLELRRKKQLDRPQEIPEETESAERSAGSVATCEEATRAARALEQLPREQADTLRLSIQRGLTQEQIAHVMGVPLGTVKTRMRIGLTRIRELLGYGSPPLLAEVAT